MWICLRRRFNLGQQLGKLCRPGGKIFKALVATGMKLNSQKSNWACRDKIPVLGYILHLPTKSLLASPTKIKGILSMCPPKDKRSTKRFVGAVSFLSQFIFGLQQLLKPLHEIASPKTPFVWTPECHRNWETIRRSIAHLPALCLHYIASLLNYMFAIVPPCADLT